MKGQPVLDMARSLAFTSGNNAQVGKRMGKGPWEPAIPRDLDYILELSEACRPACFLLASHIMWTPQSAPTTRPLGPSPPHTYPDL